MNILQALVLGIVQGLTEFLPVSSSGHLVIFEHLLNTTFEDINFDVFAHTGTLMAVIVFYRKQLLNLAYRIFSRRKINNDSREEDAEISTSWIWLIFVATIPAVIVGLIFQDYIVQAFKNIKLVGGVLLFCGIVLISTRWVPTGRKDINLIGSLFIGIAQAMAITPGLSRSGMTISMGLFLHVNPVRAADFSFLLSIPVVAGATILKLMDIITIKPPTEQIFAYIVGGISAFIVGFLCIKLLLSLIKRGKFSYFGIYCCLAGITALFLIN